MGERAIRPLLDALHDVGATSTDVLLVGDSLAEGLALPMKQIASREAITFAARATKSTTITHWLQGDLIQQTLEQLDPRLVLVCLGTNDLAGGGGAAAGRRAGELAAAILRNGAAVAWIAPPVMPFADNGFRAALSDAITPHGRLFDSTTLTVERAGDKVHGTPAGYRSWAEAIAAWVPFSAFTASGAPSPSPPTSPTPLTPPTPPAPPASSTTPSPHITLRAQIVVEGMGEMPMDDYVARVVTGEMGGSRQIQALKAQAIAARTYVSRAMRDNPALGTAAKPVANSERFQVASPGATTIATQAARETSGGVATYMGRLIIGNFVAGGVWPKGAGRGAAAATEHYVTYNQGRRGAAVIRTSLASTAHRDNRGCLSQHGADELARRGWKWPSILRFFYGEDLQFTIPEPAERPNPPRAAPPAQSPKVPKAPQITPRSDDGDSGLGVGLLALTALRFLMKT